MRIAGDREHEVDPLLAERAAGLALVAERMLRPIERVTADLAPDARDGTRDAPVRLLDALRLVVQRIDDLHVEAHRFDGPLRNVHGKRPVAPARIDEEPPD